MNRPHLRNEPRAEAPPCPPDAASAGEYLENYLFRFNNHVPALGRTYPWATGVEKREDDMGTILTIRTTDMDAADRFVRAYGRRWMGRRLGYGRHTGD